MTGGIDAAATTTSTTTTATSTAGPGFASASSSSSSASSTSSASFEIDASAVRTTEASFSGEYDISAIIESNAAWSDHWTILQFSYSLDATLEALVAKVVRVGAQIEARTERIRVMRKQVDIIAKDVRSLEADVLVIKNTESDVRLKYLRIQKQINWFKNKYSGIFAIVGDFMARLEFIESHKAQAFIDIDVLQKNIKGIKIDVKEVDTSVNNLTLEVDKLEARINAIKAEGPGIQDHIADINLRIDTLEASFTNYDVSVTKFE